jgi:hypothetical protein
MKSKDSLYADIPEGGSSEVVPTTQNTMPSGQIVKTEPVCIESKIAFKWDDIRNCNLEAIAEQADKAADEQLAIIMPRLFALIGRTSEAAGTATDAAGSPFSFDLYLGAISKIRMQFRPDGEPIMPRLVVHPEMAKVLAALPPPTEEQQQQYDAIIEAKRKDYFANRRHRKLP